MTIFSDSLASLVAGAHRLARIAASETGETASTLAYSVLGILIETGPRRTGELAAVCRISQPGMTKIISGLHERGWVERVGDPADARATVIGITDTGRAARIARLQRIGDAVEPLFAGLDDRDRAAIERAAELLAAAVDPETSAEPQAPAESETPTRHDREPKQ